MPIKSPFESSIAKPGQGKVVLSLLPPSNPSLTTLTYKYPLKLISRTPGFVPQSTALSCPSSRPVHLYLLTYGGGLLPGDHIEVSITLEQRTRLVVTTPQGSTKIFKTEPDTTTSTSSASSSSYSNFNPKQRQPQLLQPRTATKTLSDKSRQTLDVRIGKEAALCYLPDPAVPFRDSRYEQIQTFTLDCTSNDSTSSSLCLLDWVTQGRVSRGENWDFHLWKGKNELWMTDEKSKNKKLLLRDTLILDDETTPGQGIEGEDEGSIKNNILRERTNPHGVVGTLILYGPVFENLGAFIMNRFTSLPRIGARNWASSTPAAVESTPNYDSQVTFTAARVRAGCVLVKFGAENFETAKDWLGDILREEGTVCKEFGEEALLCL